MADFVPIFNENEDTVRQRLFKDIDDGWAQISQTSLDKRENTALWLIPSSAAKEAARLWDTCNDIVQLAFVQFLSGDFLSDKALEYGFVRLAAEYSEGLVGFYGIAGTTVPIGVKVSTTGAVLGDSTYNYETITEQDVYTNNGADTPTSAPTVATAGVGNLTGSYSYRFSVVEVDNVGNPIAETSQGPASTNLAAVANTLQVTDFPTLPSSAHRVRIYRTSGSGSATAIWRLVVEISDGAQTTFVDNFEDSQLGSYFVWDGTSGEDFDATRTSGVIKAHSDPAAYNFVRAIDTGVAFNVAAGEINLISSAVAGVREISNPEHLLTGRDLESDVSLKTRLLEYLQTPQGAGTKLDYQNWILEFPGVDRVKVTPNYDGTQDAPGYVYIVAADANWDPLTTSLLTIMQEGGLVNGKTFLGIDPSPTGSGSGRAPIGAKVVIDTVDKNTVAITAQVTPKQGYSLSPGAGQINLLNLINGSLALLINNLAPGETLYEAAVLQAIFSTEGVENVLMDSAGALVITPEGGADTSTDLDGNVTLGPKQVLEYDSAGSSITLIS